MLNKWSNSLAEADFHRATLAWPSWSCVSFIFVVFLMAQQQQQRQPRLQDLLSRKVLEPAVQALSDVVTDEEQPAVHPFAGVWRDERALREAKIYILNKYAHINLEKEKLYESGAYPTSGMEEWVAGKVSETLRAGIDAGVVVILQAIPFGVMDKHRKAAAAETALKKLYRAACSPKHTTPHWLDPLSEALQARASEEGPVFVLLAGKEFWDKWPPTKTAAASGNYVTRPEKGVCHQNASLTEAYYKGGGGIKTMADLDQIVKREQQQQEEEGGQAAAAAGTGSAAEAARLFPIQQLRQQDQQDVTANGIAGAAADAHAAATPGAAAAAAASAPPPAAVAVAGGPATPAATQADAQSVTPAAHSPADIAGSEAAVQGSGSAPQEEAVEEKSAAAAATGSSAQALVERQEAQQHKLPKTPAQPPPQQGQQQGDGDSTADAPGPRGYSVAAVLRSIKAEPGTVDAAGAAAAAAGSSAAAAAAAAGTSRQPRKATASEGGTFGPHAMQLLQQAAAAGLYFPNQQQMGYFLLADQPFDGPQLLELYTAHLAPHLVCKSMGRTNRSGAVREAVVTVPLGHSRVQHVYASLAPGFDKLVAALPEQQRQLLLAQQQQQQPAQKKRKVSSSGSSAAADALSEPSDAARRLLLALHCLLCWEGRRLQEQELPLLLQLLLFGGPAPAVEGVVECVDLVSDEEDESLNRQLMQGDEDMLVSKVVEPKEGGSSAGGASGSGGGGGGGSGRVRVKQERVELC